MKPGVSSLPKLNHHHNHLSHYESVIIITTSSSRIVSIFIVPLIQALAQHPCPFGNVDASSASSAFRQSRRFLSTLALSGMSMPVRHPLPFGSPGAFSAPLALRLQVLSPSLKRQQRNGGGGGGNRLLSCALRASPFRSASCFLLLDFFHLHLVLNVLTYSDHCRFQLFVLQRAIFATQHRPSISP